MLEEEGDKLFQDIQVSEEDSKYLDGIQTRLMRTCGNAEDDFAMAKSKGREVSKKLESVKKVKRTLEEEVDAGIAENDEVNFCDPKTQKI